MRKAYNAEDGDDDNGNKAPNSDDDADDGPAVVRPAGKLGSSKLKKRPQKSKLSFHGNAGEAGDGEEAEVITPKKSSLGPRVLENSALKRGLSARGLPLRSFGDDDDRPKYSKEYLDELQSSTPNTPQNVSPMATDVDEMDLDPSELDGALVVETAQAAPPKNETNILTEAEILEKKQRRARLAKEQDFLSVEDDDDGDYLGRKKKDDTRLIAEDEELGEGYDDYVEDGGLSLGKRAEKERRKRDRQKMAELITTAEGHSSDSSSDEDAERRIAYEAAQTRAGMDGLKKPRKDPAEELLQVPPKITPLPSLSECLSRLQVTLKGMDADIKSKAARVEQLRREKDEIIKREGEVQALLDETGKKYQEAMGQDKAGEATATSVGPGADLAGERGLESLGATPIRRDAGEDET